jgi:cytochrome P450
MPRLAEINPLSPETAECPFPFYEAMRNECPVYQVPGAGFFIVSRFEDVLHVLRHPEIFSSKSGPGLRPVPDEEVISIMRQGWMPVDTLLTNDPPAHARYRALVNKAFSARRVASLEPSVTQIANDLIDAFIADGEVELVQQFAVPLPLTVIADALGVDRADMDRFKRWSDDSVAPLGGFLTREREIECARSIVEFQHYFAEQLEERRTHPRDDILTDLLNAHIGGEGEEGRPLNMAEMLSILQQILVAGNETTTNLIASGMMLLTRDHALMERLAREPDRIPNFVEEALRLESPVQGLFRMAVQDTEIGGTPIPAGSRILLSYASANRDEREFDHPELIDLERENPEGHLAFGRGIHFCLGAALARLEARVAFTLLLTRLKNIRAVEEKNDYRHVPSVILRGLQRLYLTFEPA